MVHQWSLSGEGLANVHPEIKISRNIYSHWEIFWGHGACLPSGLL